MFNSKFFLQYLTHPAHLSLQGLTKIIKRKKYYLPCDNFFLNKFILQTINEYISDHSIAAAIKMGSKR